MYSLQSELAARSCARGGGGEGGGGLDSREGRGVRVGACIITGVIVIMIYAV